MSLPVKIYTFVVENLKRVQLVVCNPTLDGLTVIGGRCQEGKTSNLDGIAWALGGDRFKPSDPVHEGAEQAYVKVTLSNGLTVERSGRSGALKVSGPGKGGQALLNEFISEFALDLPKFMEARGTVRSNMLLECFPGLGPQITKLNAQIKRAYGRASGACNHAAGMLPFCLCLPFRSGSIPLWHWTCNARFRSHRDRCWPRAAAQPALRKQKGASADEDVRAMSRQWCRLGGHVRPDCGHDGEGGREAAIRPGDH